MASVLRFSDAATLALHTAALLAARPGEVTATGSIASSLSVSEAHLSKVLQRLAKVGLVRSVRGPRGGFVLARSPDKVTLLDVYEAIEGPLEPVGCLLPSGTCQARSCILGSLLGSVSRKVRDTLAGTRLSEVARVFPQTRREG